MTLNERREHGDDADIVAAWRHSSRHREEIQASEQCGCFFCGAVFRPGEITWWLDQDTTACCPLCGIDSVIGSGSGYPITDAFLLRMSIRWFNEQSALRARMFRNSPIAHQQFYRLREITDSQPYPLLFVTISGAHLYGFPSADSDYDLRGVHVLPLREVIGLNMPRETIESAAGPEGLEIDLVTHDVYKFFRLLLKKNGYVLEQLYSPLVLHTTPEHAELKEIARGCITRHHAHHYLGFARTQWGLFDKDRRVKPLLYVYRVLLTGIHLMRTGEIMANLVRLNEVFKLTHIDELIAQKVGGTEQATLEGANLEFHRREYERLTGELEAARDASTLPEAPESRDALHDLLLRIRMG